MPGNKNIFRNKKNIQIFSSIMMVLLLILTSFSSSTAQHISNAQQNEIKIQDNKLQNLSYNDSSIENSEQIEGQMAELDKDKEIKSLNEDDDNPSFVSVLKELLYQMLKSFLDRFPVLYNNTFLTNLLEYLNTSDEDGSEEDSISPSKVTGLTIVSGDNTLNLSWDLSSDNVGVDYYNIYRNESSSVMYQASSTEYIDFNVTNNVEYTYCVSAVDSSGNEGEKSDVVSAIPTDTADIIPPSQVVGLTVVDAHDGKLNLSWDVASDNVGVNFYNIYRNGSLLNSSDITDYTDSNLINGVSYSYQISAVDFAGNEGEKSVVVSGIPTESPDITPPSQVVGLTVVDTYDGCLNLTWDEATDNKAVDHYCIYRDNILIENDIENTQYQDSGLTNGQSYSYQVSAVDTSDNEGEKSVVVSGTPTESPDNIAPSKVTGLNVVDVHNGKLQISWDASTDNVEVDFYKLFRDNEFITTVNGLEYLDSGLTNGQSYSYQVSAVDTSGNEGEKSNVETGIPTESDENSTILPESGHIMISGNGYIQLNTTLNINGTFVTLIGTVYLHTNIDGIHIWWNLTTGFFKINATSLNSDDVEDIKLIDFYIEIEDTNSDPVNVLSFYFNFFSMDGASCLVLNDSGQKGSLTLNGTLNVGNINGYVSINNWQNITIKGVFYADNYKKIKGDFFVEWDITQQQPLFSIYGNLTNVAERFFNIDDLIFEIKDTIYVSAEKINFSSSSCIKIGEGFANLNSSLSSLYVKDLFVDVGDLIFNISANVDVLLGGNISLFFDEDSIFLEFLEEGTLVNLSDIYVNINNEQFLLSCSYLVINGYGSVTIADDIIVDGTIDSFDIKNLQCTLDSKSIGLSGVFNLDSSAQIYIKTDASLQTFELDLIAAATLTITDLDLNVNNGLFTVTCSFVELSGYGSLSVGEDIVADANIDYLNITSLFVSMSSKSLSVCGDFDLSASAKVYVKTDPAFETLEFSLSASGTLTITGFNLNLNNGLLVISSNVIEVSGYGSVVLGDEIILDATLTDFDVTNLHAVLNSKDLMISADVNLNSAAKVFIKTDPNLEKFEIYLAAAGSITISGLNVNLDNGDLKVTAISLSISGYGTLHIGDHIVCDATLTSADIDTLYAELNSKTLTLSGYLNLDSAASLVNSTSR